MTRPPRRTNSYRKPSRLEVRLAKYLQENGHGELVTGSLERTYAGWGERAHGAWSWFARYRPVGVNSSVEVGSQYPLRFLMRRSTRIDTGTEHGALTLDPAPDDNLN